MFLYESDNFETKLDRRDILNLLKELKPYKDGLIIEFKAALVLYGVCDKCNDIDISCNAKVAKELKKKYKVLGKSEFNGAYRIEINERVEVFEDPDFDISDTSKICGFRLRNIESIYNRYKRLNRPKDQKTMKQIEKFCKKQDISLNITESEESIMVDLIYELILESLVDYVANGELEYEEAEMISEAAYDELFYEARKKVEAKAPAASMKELLNAKKQSDNRLAEWQKMAANRGVASGAGAGGYKGKNVSRRIEKDYYGSVDY